MRTITFTQTVYKFEELTGEAQETALEFFRQNVDTDQYADHVIEDAARVADILGIVFDTTKNEPSISWRGFWSQGDGASFTGAYAHKRGAAKAIREYAPNDKTLHAIADNLQAAQRKFFFKVLARITAGPQRNHYSHENTVIIDCEHNDYSSIDVSSVQEPIANALRDFMRWIYSQLRDSYEYETSDDVLKANIAANEYEFNEFGNLA